MQKNLVIAVVISAVVFGGAGYAFGKSGATGNATSVVGQNGVGGRGNFTANGARGARGMGGGAVGGQIIAKDANSITLELRGTQTDGSAGSKIVFLSDKTLVTKSATGSIEDLAVGTQVMAIGATNADGSVNAQSVQIRPAGTDGARRATSSPQ